MFGPLLVLLSCLMAKEVAYHGLIFDMGKVWRGQCLHWRSSGFKVFHLAALFIVCVCVFEAALMLRGKDFTDICSGVVPGGWLEV